MLNVFVSLDNVKLNLISDQNNVKPIVIHLNYVYLNRVQGVCKKFITIWYIVEPNSIGPFEF